MTTEILRNLLYKVGTATETLGLSANLSLAGLSAVIFDECHYMNDPDRGHVWEETMILLPPSVQMVLLSATLDRPEFLANWLTEIKGEDHPTHLIQADYRVVPLNHCLLFPSADAADTGDESYKIQTIMRSATGESEVFADKIYESWLRALRNAPQAHAQAKAARQAAALSHDPSQVAVTATTNHEQSIRPQTFQHRMNSVLEFLKTKNLLPALFFVLSRNNCERYASQVQTDFLDTHEISSVRSIVGFHLSRHMDILSTMPQWNTIYTLLQRGIAYHHSGLIPQIKEIIELLFSRGLVRLLFCTETFAVGLNMPTKTTLFAGFQKYDEQRDQMRMLRTDEYLQMAGRAGRRGKDKEGWAIYLPDRDPVSTADMRRMITGGCQALISRMELGFDLILKTLLGSSTNSPLDILGKSYWYRLRLAAIENNKKEISALENKIQAAGLDAATEKELEERKLAEEAVRTTTNAPRKEAQRRLEGWKNRHMGPRWEKAWKAWGDVVACRTEILNLNSENAELADLGNILDERLGWLQQNGYVDFIENNGTELGQQKAKLTKKGLMATECNEACLLILPEFYENLGIRRQDLIQNPNHLIVLLSAFLEPIQRDSSADTMHALACVRQSKIPQIIKSSAELLFSLANKVQDVEGVQQRSLRLSGDWMELLWGWLEEDKDPNILCQEYEIFEGNFVRGIMKLGNILDEWLSLATLCGDTGQIEAVAGLRPKLGRDFIIQDSLYLRIE